MKRCSLGNHELPLEEFGMHLKNGIRVPNAWCRNCKREYDRKKKRELYLDDSARKEVTERNKAIRAASRKILNQYLLSHHCVECGESDKRVLDFDHDDPSTKHKNVTELLGSPKLLIKEIAKCTVRCGNCHRHKTMHEQNSWRAAYCRRDNCQWAVA